MNTSIENDTQCELAAWELLREARRERDEARGALKIALEQWEIALDQLQLHKRKAERIRELEGATNHAGGTPLTIALRERNEWSALCGRYKQERDHLRSIVDRCRETLDLPPINWEAAK